MGAVAPVWLFAVSSFDGVQRRILVPKESSVSRWRPWGADGSRQKQGEQAASRGKPVR